MGLEEEIIQDDLSTAFSMSSSRYVVTLSYCQRRVMNIIIKAISAPIGVVESLPRFLMS